MKIEIKKLKFGLIGREGIRTFECQLWIDGKHTANVNEDGNGGCLRIYFFTPECREINKKADEWLKSADNKVDGNDLESFIINLVSNIETEKQLAKDQKKGICWTKPGNTKEYNLTSWKGKKIDEMLGNQVSLVAVRDVVMKLHREGNKILNTNLPESWLKQLA